MGASHVNQSVKEQPSALLPQTEFDIKDHTKVCPLTSTLRELWKNKKNTWYTTKL